jgi:hypothetical protein
MCGGYAQQLQVTAAFRYNARKGNLYAVRLLFRAQNTTKSKKEGARPASDAVVAKR